MAIDIVEFHEELFQQVQSVADAAGRFAEDTFFDIVTGSLTDAGDIETADRVHYVSPRGIRVDGYGGDPLVSDNILNLIIADFSQSQSVVTLTATEMEATFRRVSNFLEKSLDDKFRNGLEESTPAYGLADLISARWANVSRVRLFLISNKILSSRIDRREASDFRGVPVTYTVWDLGRIHRYVTSGHEHEDIIVDLDKFGGALPILPAQITLDDYESYLAVFPGKQLARIYDHWGARLLEQNLRVFLQARGKINRGIRNTLANEPDMFFAYNNGITATAESIGTSGSADGLLLTSIHNFQIVNGGQTTASIHAALQDKTLNLDRVFVQMKLSIVDTREALEVVPKISEYANSQNRVSASDFFSNHPFHIRIETFSRRLYAPSKDGSFRQSKWFYERARGQYQEARSRLTQAERRRFDLEFPKNQMFTKTDLAKFMNVWREKPDMVSRGAQKNFADFASFVGGKWERNSDEFNEVYYREAVSAAIVFRSVERLVTEQSWYQGGYRANVVAYTIAKLAYDVAQRREAINFDRIWRTQDISDGLREALRVSATAIHRVIVDAPEGIRNVTEWAKQQACWNRVKALEVHWPESLDFELISSVDRVGAHRSAIKDQRMLNGIEAQVAVVQAGAAMWRDVKKWGRSKNLLSPDDLGILSVAESIPSKVPSEKQSLRILDVLRRLHGEGCQLGNNLR